MSRYFCLGKIGGVGDSSEELCELCDSDPERNWDSVSDASNSWRDSDPCDSWVRCDCDS